MPFSLALAAQWGQLLGKAEAEKSKGLIHGK
jgi:hypothetical protein